MTAWLAGRKVLITGAAKGIGRAVAERVLAEKGAVAALDRDASGLRDMREGLGAAEHLHCQVIDVSDRAAVGKAMGDLGATLGGLDLVVNSAGIDLYQDFEDMAGDAWQAVIDVNLTGAIAVCQAAVPLLKQSGGGAIVNVASAAGLLPIAKRVAYCASKAGLVMATKAMAMDLARHGIRANAVCPGAVDTELFRGALGGELTRESVEARYALGRVASVEEIVGAILFLGSDEASYITGAALAVDGGRSFH